VVEALPFPLLGFDLSNGEGDTPEASVDGIGVSEKSEGCSRSAEPSISCPEANLKFASLFGDWTVAKCG
jgi:hypothetical protein